MTLHPTTPAFKQNAHDALNDTELQKALGHVQGGFINKRQSAVERLPEFEVLRDAARDLKDHVLAHLDPFSKCAAKVHLPARAAGAGPGPCRGSPARRAPHAPCR